MNGLRLLITAALATTLIACEETPNTANQDAINETGFFAKFSPSDSIIPFPNNLLFQGTVDGTLEIPIPAVDVACPNAGEIALKTALNDLDGFSTVAPISTNFSSAINTSSLLAGSSVRVFIATLGALGEVNGITGELDATEFAVGVSSVNNEIANAACDTEELGANKLVISPLKPLAPKTTYLVALTKDIKGPNGNNAAADLVYTFTKSTSSLLLTPTPIALSDLAFGALKSKVDFNDDGVVDVDVDKSGTIDAADLTAYLASMGDLEGLRLLTNASEGWVEAYTVTIDNAGAATITDLPASDIILSWTFSTQSVGDVLTVVQTDAAATVKTSALDPTPVGSSPAGAADLYAGTLTTNYYLNAATGVNDAAPLAGSWRATVAPSVTVPLTQYTALASLLPDSAPVNIPLLVSVPKIGSGPWPVVIFQHGITRNRTDMLTIADTMAAAGMAVVAIDMPLHGLTNNETDGTKAFYAGAGNERTFDLDLVNNATSAPGPDTVTDESGKHYINLASLLTTRDNVRQSVSDLYVLRKALETMTADAHSFDANKIYFVGHSMGGLVGTVLLATEPNIKSGVLAMPGGGIAKLLDGSASISPEIAAGLAANGINKGFAQYEAFLASAQMFIDSADPINYAADTATGRGVLLFEVVGDGANNLPDQTVPNHVLGLAGTVSAPLSGTNPLITEMGLTQQGTSTTGVDLGLVVKYTAGHHGSILTPNDADGNADLTSAAVVTEMQSEMASFIFSDGAAISITDDTVIEVP